MSDENEGEEERDLVEANPLMVRDRIQKVENDGMRKLLAAGYLLAARPSELLGYDDPSDDYQASKMCGDDLAQAQIEGKTAYLFNVRTLKRGSQSWDTRLVRTVGLPAEPYDEWVRPVWEYIYAAAKAPAFAYKRHRVNQWLHEVPVFAGLGYRIEPYSHLVVGLEGKLVREMTQPKMKAFDFKGLRHVRSQELRRNYRFTPLEVAAFVGHSARTATGVGAAGAYDKVEWWEYFPKLLNRIDMAPPPRIVDVTPGH